MAVALAGCGATSPSGQKSALEPPIANAGLAKSALQHLKAPIDFHSAACEFLTKRAYTRCYRRNTYVPLNAAMFAALITATGLKPNSGTLTCPHIRRSRNVNSVRWGNCQARANAASIEFDVFAHSIKILHPNAIKQSDRTLAAKLRGTVFELAVVTSD